MLADVGVLCEIGLSLVLADAGVPLPEVPGVAELVLAFFLGGFAGFVGGNSSLTASVNVSLFSTISGRLAPEYCKVWRLRLCPEFRSLQ